MCCTLHVCFLLHVCSVVSHETTVMNVVECDPYCHQYSGCSERGKGKCDHFCVTGRGIDPSTYTCMGEDNFILVSIRQPTYTYVYQRDD